LEFACTMGRTNQVEARTTEVAAAGPPNQSSKQRAWLAGARARWGPPRIVRLDALTGGERRLILALIDAAKAEHDEVAEATRE
jgi:hypothetical protein